MPESSDCIWLFSFSVLFSSLKFSRLFGCDKRRTCANGKFPRFVIDELNRWLIFIQFAVVLALKKLINQFGIFNGCCHCSSAINQIRARIWMVCFFLDFFLNSNSIQYRCIQFSFGISFGGNIFVCRSIFFFIITAIFFRWRLQFPGYSFSLAFSWWSFIQNSFCRIFHSYVVSFDRLHNFRIFLFKSCRFYIIWFSIWFWQTFLWTTLFYNESTTMLLELWSNSILTSFFKSSNFVERSLTYSSIFWVIFVVVKLSFNPFDSLII